VGTIQDSSAFARAGAILSQVGSLKHFQRRKLHKKLKKHPHEAVPLAALWLQHGDQALIERLKLLDWIE
jgi:hypothetical protein